MTCRIPALPGLLALCLPALLHAQQFRSNLPIPLDPDEAIRFAGDLDGDGDADLVVSRTAALEARVLTNLGGGRFVRQPATATHLRTDGRDWAAADIDGDGDLDLFSDGSGQGLLLLRNDGTALVDVTASNLQLVHTAPTSPFAFVDFDQDGDQDILALLDPIYSQLLLNDGAGRFTELWPNPLPTNLQGAYSILVRDFDGDGAEDLLTNSPSGVFLWMHRQGTYVDESGARLPVLPGFPTSIAELDYDGDGDIDLAIGTLQNQLQTSTRLLENQGNGVFVDVTAQRMPPYVLDVRATSAMDFDADGHTDLIVLTSSQPAVLLHNQAGQGFVPVGSNWRGDLMVNETPIAAIDFDGDRFPDLLTSQALLRNVQGTTLRSMSRQPQLGAQLLADADGDGDPDALGTAGLWRNEGGQFTLEATSPTQRGAAGDLDGDGDVDVVARGGGGIEVRRNDGLGNFTVLAILPASSIVNAMALGDVDGDGDLDLATAEGLDVITIRAQSRLWLNDGRGNFTDATATNLPANLAGLLSAQFADADADGDLDLVFAVSQLSAGPQAPVRYYQNQGNGVFVDASQLVQTLPNTFLPTSRAFFAQLDADPELELIDVLGSAVRLFDRVGATWQDVTSTRLPAAVPTAISGASALDFDEDGDLDLVLSNSEAAWLLANDGNGTFVDVTATRGAGIRSAGLVADLDGDGDLDLVSTTQVLFNQQRQLSLPLPPRVGHTSTIEYVAEPGFGTQNHLALVGLSLDRQAHPTTSPLGTFFLGSGVMFGALVSNQGSTGTAQLSVPANPALSGLPLYFQGIDLTLPSGALHLTNVVATRIE